MIYLRITTGGRQVMDLELEDTRRTSAARRTTVRCLVLGASLVCLACNTHREAPVTQSAPSVEAGAPSVEAGVPSVVVNAAIAAIEIANVPTFVTTTGPPHHVRLSVTNHSAVASTVSIRGVDSVDGSLRRPLTIRSLALDAAGPQEDAGQTFVVTAGSTVSVTLSIANDTLPPNAASYDFVVTAVVDGVARIVDVSVQRARREPLRR